MLSRRHDCVKNITQIICVLFQSSSATSQSEPISLEILLLYYSMAMTSQLGRFERFCDWFTSRIKRYARSRRCIRHSESCWSQKTKIEIAEQFDV